jgi:hypothetical protein
MPAFYIREPGAAGNMRELWTAIDGSASRKVGTIGPLAPESWWYDVSLTNQVLDQRQNAKPAPALGGGSEIAAGFTA